MRSRVLEGSLPLLDLVKNIGHRREAEERWEDRSSEETEKSQASAKPETRRGTQMSAGRRLAAGGAGERREGSMSFGSRLKLLLCSIIFFEVICSGWQRREDTATFLGTLPIVTCLTVPCTD